MSDYIKRDDVLAILASKGAAWEAFYKIKKLPAENVVERELYECALNDIVKQAKAKEAEESE